ncbi:MAG: GNAT family N-acetyltransferase [Lachnospiraceae bacterium]|nr:GNAT family N-acetyltransferase [Lachnospiraceae bacterium]
MLKKVEFILEQKWKRLTLGEAAEVKKAYRIYGLETDVRFCQDPAGFLQDFVPGYETLTLVDSDRLVRALQEKGVKAAGYRHGGNSGESLFGVPYVLEEPACVDADSLQKIWQRLHSLPWMILATERCIVREFVTEDLDAMTSLYDKEACRWLEPPSPDREKERQIMQAYIDRIYGMYGYGQWAVVSRDTGALIGRMGFSFPAQGFREAFLLQNGRDLRPDATLGYLLGSPYRGKGLAREVCSALVEYGFDMLGFSLITIEIDPRNKASAALAEALGFTKAGRLGEQAVYYKEGK